MPNAVYSYTDHHILGLNYHRGENEAKTLTLGTEVEMEAPNHAAATPFSRMAQIFYDAAPDKVHCKTDGSLDSYDYGVELISEPCSLQYHMFDMKWKYLFKLATDNGYFSNDSTNGGMHVHVGREQLGETDTDRSVVIRKCIVIVYKYWSKLKQFTRRLDSELNWCRKPSLTWYRVGMTGDELRVAARQIQTYIPDHGARYTAVNVTNTNTIEFRIFKGTLDREIYIANLQLVSNIVRYAQTHTWDEIQASTWEDIAQYENYRELVDYLVARELGHAVPDDQLRFKTKRATVKYKTTDGDIRRGMDNN